VIIYLYNISLNLTTYLFLLQFILRNVVGSPDNIGQRVGNKLEWLWQGGVVA